jgi:hypothetical protein
MSLPAILEEDDIKTVIHSVTKERRLKDLITPGCEKESRIRLT